MIIFSKGETKKLFIQFQNPEKGNGPPLPSLNVVHDNNESSKRSVEQLRASMLKAHNLYIPYIPAYRRHSHEKMLFTVTKG